MAHHLGVPRAARARARPSRIRARCSARSRQSAATTWPRRRSRWPPGICRRGSRGVRSATLLGGIRAISDRNRRRLDRHPGLARRARRAGRDRAARPATGASRSRSSRAGTWTRSSAFATRFGDIPLMVDANAAYTPRTMRRTSPSSTAFDLMMIEQPLDYDDIRDHARLQRQHPHADLPRRVALHTSRLAEEAIELGACRIINIKPGRVGGHAESIRMHDIGRGAWHPGLARRHARERHRPRAQHSSLDAAEFHAAGRRRRQPAILRARPDRSGDRGRADGTIAVPTGPGIGVRSCTTAWSRRRKKGSSCAFDDD